MNNKALGIIISNINEKQLGVLTSGRTLASVPFGGRYRLIDFGLSNMSNSGIYNVVVIARNNYQSLLQHVGSGKSWDLSRKIGGLRILPPKIDKVYNSRWEALLNAAHVIKNSDERYVVIADGDCVCNFDFSKAIAYHADRMSDLTVIYRKKELVEGDLKDRLCLTLDDDGRVTEAAKRPAASGAHCVGAQMYIIGREFLLSLLTSSEDRNITSLEKDVICKSASELRIYGYELSGYFATMDSIPNYFAHSMELIDRNKCATLFDSDGANIYTKVRDSVPTRFAATCEVKNSIIADGCDVKGRVENSILFRGVRVAEGAVIKNSILFQDTVVAPSC